MYIHPSFIISVPPLHVENTPFSFPVCDFLWGAGAEVAEGSLGSPSYGEWAVATARAIVLPGWPGWDVWLCILLPSQSAEEEKGFVIRTSAAAAREWECVRLGCRWDSSQQSGGWGKVGHASNKQIIKPVSIKIANVSWFLKLLFLAGLHMFSVLIPWIQLIIIPITRGRESHINL